MSECLIGDQISVYKKADEQRLNAIILTLIKNHLAERMNMSTGAMMQLTEDIKRMYWFYRVPEIALVLRKGVSGDFGNVPRGVDPVLYWFRQYDLIRDQYFEAEALKFKETNEKIFDEMERKEIKEKAKSLKDEINRHETRTKAKEIVKQKRNEKT